MFADKILICRDCLGEFLFSTGEQQFFASRGLTNEPRRCSNCRLVLRTRRNGLDVSQLADVNCAECGAVAKVPFQPRGHAPVYCTACFMAKKRAAAGDIKKEPLAV